MTVALVAYLQPLICPSKPVTVLVLVIVIGIGKRLSKGCDIKKDSDYEHRFAEHEHE